MHILITYGSLEGRSPCGLCAARAPPKAGPSGGDFFSRLETLVSGSSGVVLFVPRGERMPDSSPCLSSLTVALVPSVGVGSDGGPLSPHYSPLCLPLRAPGKVLARASFPVPDSPSLPEGGPNTGSSSPLLTSPGQRAISQNNVMINERQCVRLEDSLLGRWCGCCSGPRPR